MGFSGNLGALGKLASNIAKLGEVPSRAAPIASEKIAELIAAEFDSESDAYGNAWAAHAQGTIDRWGAHAILDLFGGMRGGVAVLPQAGAGITVSFSVPYAGYHHTGTGRMPARPVMPLNTMPAAWSAALRDATKAAYARTIGAR